MKILLDTNVVLDFALGRQEYLETTKILFQLLSDKNITSYVTATTITDVYYILKKSDGHKKTLDFLTDFIQFAEVAGVDKTIIQNALNSGMPDFEDAVQNESAITHELSAIITRNKKDFSKSKLEIHSPNEFLEKYLTQSLIFDYPTSSPQS